jgi:hypothetical protein
MKSGCIPVQWVPAGGKPRPIVLVRPFARARAPANGRWHNGRQLRRLHCWFAPPEQLQSWIFVPLAVF